MLNVEDAFGLLAEIQNGAVEPEVSRKMKFGADRDSHCFANLSVKRSLSPIASYFARSLSFRR
jgi:hypothetical protein